MTSATWTSLGAALCLLSSFHPAMAAPQDVESAFGENGQAVVQGSSQGIPGGVTAVGDVLYVVAPGNVVARLSRDGLPDASFGNAGRLQLPFSATLVFVAAYPDSSGRLLLVGGSQSAPFPSLPAVARFDRNGVIDKSFANQGIYTDNVHEGLFRGVRIIDGKIYALGVQTNPASGSAAPAIVVRLAEDGKPDTTFGNGGTAILNVGGVEVPDLPVGGSLNIQCSQAQQIAPASGGNLLISVVTDIGCGLLGGAVSILRIKNTGAMDTSFGQAGSRQVLNDKIVAGALPVAGENGKVAVAAVTSGALAAPEVWILRLNENGSTDSSFDGDGQQGGASQKAPTFTGAMAVQSSGKLVVGVESSATSLLGTMRTGLYRVNGSPELVNTGAEDEESGSGGGALGIVATLLFAAAALLRRRRML